MKLEDVTETPIPAVIASQKIVESPQIAPATQDFIAEGFFEILGLPSAMKLYPDGTRIWCRPLRVIECKQLAGINSENADNIINSVLKRAVRGLEHEKILVADKLFILLWLRGVTFPDPSFGINFKCNICEKESKYNFSLDKIEIRQIDEKFTADKLKFSLPNKAEITFAFPTISEEKMSENFIANTTFVKDLDKDLVSQAVLIREINGEKKTMLERYNYLATLSPESYVFFLSYIEKWSFGIKYVITAECSLCGGPNQMGVFFLNDPGFFLPRVDISKD
jgi:hypothetical protein